MEKLTVNKALEDIFALVKRANKYIDETAPWVLAREESKKPRLMRVMYNLLEVIRVTSSLLLPFFSGGPGKALDALGVGVPAEFGTLAYGGVKAYSTHETEALYPRLDLNKELKALNEISAAKAKEEKAAPAPEEKSGRAHITIDDFCKLDLRVAEVIACERVPKSDKLLKETLKVGDEVRTVCSGIARYYTPEEMVGKKVVLVANLPPRKMCGIESQGMLLCAEKDGKVVLLSPESDIGSGAEIG